MPRYSAMNRSFSTYCVIAFICGLVCAAVGQSAVGQPTTDKNCTDCHPEFKKRLSGKYNHKPFADDECEACHRYHGFRNKTELAGKVIDICSACHAAHVDLPQNAIHYPVIENNSCVECHLPHGADNKLFLKKKVHLICLDCHDPPTDASGIVHPPYAEMACVVCHDPHGSLFGPFLKLPAGYVCLSCHETILQDYSPDQMHTGEEIGSCEHCHSGHYTGAHTMLLAEVNALCTGCHREIIDSTAQIQPHSALTEENCLVCHLPHFQKGTSALRENPPELCLACHNDTGERLKLEFPHPPAAEDCLTCHDPHRRMAKKEELDLCTGCHDLEDPDFLELHFNITPQGCTDCHNPHGSTMAKLIPAIEHPPFADRECAVCHDAAAGAPELRSSDLCLKCHEVPDPTDFHPAEQIARQTCVDCHRPHAADAAHLIRPKK